jgi:hypothetical protein
VVLVVRKDESRYSDRRRRGGGKLADKSRTAGRRIGLLCTWAGFAEVLRALTVLGDEKSELDMMMPTSVGWEW